MADSPCGLSSRSAGRTRRDSSLDPAADAATYADSSDAVLTWSPIQLPTKPSELPPEDDLLGSPLQTSKGKHAVVSSPSLRPRAPAAVYFKSPPPVVSDRRARMEKRQRQSHEVESAANLVFCDLGDVSSPITTSGRESSPVPPAINPSSANDSWSTSGISPPCPLRGLPPHSGRASQNSGRASQNSLFSVRSSAPSSADVPYRAVETPPAGSDAFETYATLVKCPAPKRARAVAVCRTSSLIDRRRFAFD